MTTPDWAELTRFAIALAEASAEAILPYFRQNTHVEVKDGPVWDPVTEGDRAGERAIRAMIEERYPDHGILGEEYGMKEARSPFTWVLDPVDGTRSFVCGMPTWATLIGLSFEGKPALGLMNQPVVGDMFYGNPQGAWHDHRGRTAPIATRKGITPEPRHDRHHGARTLPQRGKPAPLPGAEGQGPAHPLWRGCLFLLHDGSGPHRHRHGLRLAAL